MKAILVTERGGPEVLKVRDLPVPIPGEGQVRVKVAAAGVNYADIMARRGTYHLAPPLPFVPGIEVAGTVARIGPKVSGLKVGDRVVGFARGGYAEFSLLSAALTYPIPAGVSLEDAAAHFLVFNTAFHCLKSRARVQAGETVLVQAAAGGVGTAAVQLAKLFGARVLACASRDEKLERVKALGADVTLNYLTQDFLEEARRETGGRGVDVVLESVGGEVFEKSLEALADGGRLVAFGSASGKVGRIEVPILQRKNLTVAGFGIQQMAARDPDSLRPAATVLLDLLKERKIHPVIGGTYGLPQAAEAHHQIESRQGYGKFLLKP